MGRHPRPRPRASHSRLFRNRGATQPGHFDDVTAAAGVSIEGPGTRQPFSPAFVDLDRDGWRDLALVADAGTTRLFWNDGDGTFTDGTDAAGVGLTGSEMGSTFADVDLDGDLDWFVTAISCQPPYRIGPTCTGNNFYHYEGGRVFSQQNSAAGVTVGHWGWGAAFFDYDNDGDPDLVQTNGESLPFDDYEVLGEVNHYRSDPMRFWENDGTGQMSERSAVVGLTDTGEGKGLLVLDYDGDGDLDVLVVHTGTGPKLYRNDGGNRNGWLRIRTIGTASNRDGYGAQIRVVATAGAAGQIREIGVDTHFLGQSERIAHVGLGPGVGPVERRGRVARERRRPDLRRRAAKHGVRRHRALAAPARCSRVEHQRWRSVANESSFDQADATETDQGSLDLLRCLPRWDRFAPPRSDRATRNAVRWAQ